MPRRTRRPYKTTVGLSFIVDAGALKRALHTQLSNSDSKEACIVDQSHSSDSSISVRFFTSMMCRASNIVPCSIAPRRASGNGKKLQRYRKTYLEVGNFLEVDYDHMYL